MNFHQEFWQEILKSKCLGDAVQPYRVDFCRPERINCPLINQWNCSTEKCCNSRTISGRNLELHLCKRLRNLNPMAGTILGLRNHVKPVMCWCADNLRK
jgi:hypothetical protein